MDTFVLIVKLTFGSYILLGVSFGIWDLYFSGESF